MPVDWRRSPAVLPPSPPRTPCTPLPPPLLLSPGRGPWDAQGGGGGTAASAPNGPWWGSYGAGCVGCVGGERGAAAGHGGGEPCAAEPAPPLDAPLAPPTLPAAPPAGLVLAWGGMGAPARGGGAAAVRPPPKLPPLAEGGWLPWAAAPAIDVGTLCDPASSSNPADAADASASNPWQVRGVMEASGQLPPSPPPPTTPPFGAGGGATMASGDPPDAVRDVELTASSANPSVGEPACGAAGAAAPACDPALTGGTGRGGCIGDGGVREAPWVHLGEEASRRRPFRGELVADVLPLWLWW